MMTETQTLVLALARDVQRRNVLDCPAGERRRNA